MTCSSAPFRSNALRAVLLLVAALGAYLALGAGRAAAATTFSVTRTDDPAPGMCDGDCSLREAGIPADATPGVDTIELAAGQTYTLSQANTDTVANATTGDLDVSEGVDIRTGGPGPNATIDANGDV